MFPSLLEFFPLLLSRVKWLCCHCKSVGEWETQNKFLVKRLPWRLPPPIPPRAVIEKNEIPFTISSNSNSEKVHLIHSKLDPNLHTPPSNSVPDYVSWQRSNHHSRMTWLYREPGGMILLCTVCPFSNVDWMKEQLTEKSSPPLCYLQGPLYFPSRVAERLRHMIEETRSGTRVPGSFPIWRCRRNTQCCHSAFLPVSSLHPPRADRAIVWVNTD